MSADPGFGRDFNFAARAFCVIGRRASVLNHRCFWCCLQSWEGCSIGAAI